MIVSNGKYAKMVFETFFANSLRFYDGDGVLSLGTPDSVNMEHTYEMFKLRNVST